MARNKRMVLTLYNSLSLGNKSKATALLAPNVDWWFHGPPGRDHMMQVLTGVDVERFRFVPRRVAKVGEWVVAEGWGLNRQEDSYWVHVWLVDGGVITKFREYFNTCVTIRELGEVLGKLGDETVWKSRELRGRPLPGLVLVV
ncbi:wound-induced protein 1-like [Phalaenopsis equestris]|uniref:wound-induced protein 1-like n=1 Tax=Phalaenopsis equestris TaxID=78828 RepID=UPI0009E2CC5A|nr:wound-induced protein 1-like [Phalaenopsis equestris]